MTTTTNVAAAATATTTSYRKIDPREGGGVVYSRASDVYSGRSWDCYTTTGSECFI